MGTARSKDVSYREARKVYSTAEWKRARELKLTTQPLCEDCLGAGRETLASHADHDKSIASGGAVFDMANLRSLCVSCHSRKTYLRDGSFGRPRLVGASEPGADGE